MATAALPPAAEATHLTAVLRKSGVLDGTAVREVIAQSSRDTLVSRIIRLALSYDGPAPGAPRSLIMKVAHADYASTLWNAGRQEVAFYRDVAPLMPAGLVPFCFDSSWNDETHAWHLLLEDLTDTHQVGTAWPVPPTFEKHWGKDSGRFAASLKVVVSHVCCFVSMIAEWFFCTPLLRRRRKHRRPSLSWR